MKPTLEGSACCQESCTDDKYSKLFKCIAEDYRGSLRGHLLLIAILDSDPRIVWIFLYLESFPIFFNVLTVGG